MGFKFKRIDFLAGSEEFPFGDSDVLNRQRACNVLKAIAQALIDCNCGWQLDTARNATTTDFSDVPCRTGSKTCPGLFFRNTISGCKLFMSYFCNVINEGIKDFSETGDSIFRCYSGTDRFSCGVCSSMIPEGSSSEFGNSFDSSFLPEDATRIIGTSNNSTIGYNNNTTLVYDPQAGYILSWGILATPYVISIFAGYNQNNTCSFNVPVYAIGRIFGVLAHTEDNTNQSKYGVLNFKFSDNSNRYTEGVQDSMNSESGYMYGTDQTTYISMGQNPARRDWSLYDWLKYSWFNAGSFSKADGTWINGSDRTNYLVNMYATDLSQLSPYIYNSLENKRSRWTPYAMVCVSKDLNNYCVVPGDSFKGYIDTELFINARGVYCQLMDNGNYICAFPDRQFVIGWDPSNTDSLSG